VACSCFSVGLERPPFCVVDQRPKLLVTLCPLSSARALMVRRALDPESNLCFGEGGAGTWSDGKLTTRIGRNSDPVRHVLRTLVDLGAPESILVAGKPHLGTDRLVRILRAFRLRLQALGARVVFGARVDDLLVEEGISGKARVKGVRLADGSEVRASRVVLAVGHSARDVYMMLRRHGAPMTPKPFAMGFRIEHPQALIDAAQYGNEDAAAVLRGKGKLPVADYSLTAQIPLSSSSPDIGSADSLVESMNDGRGASAGLYDYSSGAVVNGTEQQQQQQSLEPTIGVFSFCMCPGGQIVPTSTSPTELCINGMSFSRRDSRWANSALVAEVGPQDWAPFVDEHGELAGVELQRAVERSALFSFFFSFFFFCLFFFLSFLL
jgi:uncharacterized FAD-dependent dehydrogenase